ncbi:MAG TPA: aldo/keto reductase [Candidatus Corynebacterium faecigallinarum]|uniref:Aldo/keto reductase n=1 Tax=Candidatus Corynebacterium faecigallinarum TaxID=2838528 RepID=A0A9D2QDT7_9CORY|nr:aldo/keto reductase [Candidatus Corynebacterium faecigallinarum]
MTDTTGTTDFKTNPITLNDGHEIPQLGLGVWELSPEDAYSSVRAAITAGARHIDTAAIYGNEKDVGRAVADAIADGEVTREDLYITTKLWNSDQGFDSAKKAIETSLGNLGLDYVDLYLIHWPSAHEERYVDSWKALIDLRTAGKTRSIGVANFYPEVLDAITEATGVVPAINQIELHPGLSQRAQRADDSKRGIVTQSWTPLGRGLLDHPVIAGIAETHGVTPAQVIIRWHLQQGIVVFPRSSKPERVRENLDVDGFELTTADIDAITALDDDETAAGRVGADPRDTPEN